MEGLRKTLGLLQHLRHRFEQLLGAQKKGAHRSQTSAAQRKRLRAVALFGPNPGNLRMRVHVPDNLPTRPALVVALHGCTQTADEYDLGSGWSRLADRHGFLVVYPQQQPSNNPKNCFSWFLPGDTTRGQGEAHSIRQMVEHAIANFRADRRRVFVTGLSSGGAMASAMLATYPDIFAAGAMVAGLPYGCAGSVKEAFEAMFTEQSPSARALGDRVRTASQHRGPWPRISVWHGTADAMVKAANAENIISQWRNVHRLPAHASHEEIIAGHLRRIWNDASGRTLIEAFSIVGMPHGWPISTHDSESYGEPGPFFLDVGISATHQIAKFWGLQRTGAETLQNVTGTMPAHVGVGAANVELAAVCPDSSPASAKPPQTPHATHGEQRAFDPNCVIAAAFAAAGLPPPNVPRAPFGARPRVLPGPIIDAALKAAGLIKE